MYNEKLATAILERLDKRFPDAIRFHNLYDPALR